MTPSYKNIKDVAFLFDHEKNYGLPHFQTVV